MYTQLLLASTVQAWAKQSAQYGLSTKMQFAWKAFLYKAFDFLQQYATDSSKLNTSPSVLELRRQLQASDGVSEEKTTTIPDSWANRYKFSPQTLQVGVHRTTQCQIFKEIYIACDLGAWS